MVKVFKSLIVDKHGSPERILTDNGLEFNNNEFKLFCQDYRIQQCFNSPRHHETVGCIERANQSLLNKIRKLNNYEIRGWEKVVARAVYGLNISVNRAIGLSPFVLKYFKQPKFNSDIKYGKENQNYNVVELLSRRKKNFLEFSEKHIKRNQERKKKYKVGDGVLRYKEAVENKLGSNWEEGFVVVNIVSDHAYVVKKEGKSYRVNERHLRLNSSKEKKISEGGML